jgi:restriction endonuclease Mrr
VLTCGFCVSNRAIWRPETQRRRRAPTRIQKRILLKIAQTPEEQIEAASVALRENFGEEILAKMKAASPSFFERLVVELLVRMGYGGTRKDAGRAIGRSGDEGIDGIIKEDRLGLDVIYIQAKKWAATVGRPEIQKFAGALQGFRAKRGIFNLNPVIVAHSRWSGCVLFDVAMAALWSRDKLIFLLCSSAWKLFSR